MGRSLRVGRGALPDWVPAPGTFADVGLNTPKDVYSMLTETRGPFANWSSGIRAADSGPYGTYDVQGSGHLAEGTELAQGILSFDPVTRLWSRRCAPSEPHYEDYTDPPQNQWGEYSDGSVYPAHTYQSLSYQSTAHGGGTHGSMIRFPAPGVGDGKAVHRFDLSQASGGVTRVIDDLGLSTTYSQCAWDSSRNGWWVLGYAGPGPLKFVSAADWSVTSYSGVQFNASYYHQMVYLADHDALISFGASQFAAPQPLSMYVLPLSTLGSGGNFTNCMERMSGDVPTKPGAGGVWSELLQRVVSYQGVEPYDEDLSPGYVVRKLAIPADLLTGDWVWTSETLTGADGAIPSYSKDGNNDPSNNGTFSRFVEFPALRCLLFCGSVFGPTQAWRLTGM